MSIRYRDATIKLTLLTWSLSTLLLPAISFAQSDSSVIEFLDMPRVEITELLRILSESAQVSIIPGREVKGQVSVFLRNIEAELALQEIIEANGYRYVRKGDIIRVMTEQDFETYHGTDLEQRVFSLRFAKATQIVPLVQSALSPRGRAVPDANNNQIIVTDLPQRFDGIATLVEALDLKGTTRIFSLKHAMVSDIRSILQSLVGDPSKLRIDERTNRLIVSDTPERLDFLAEIIEELDLEDLTETRTYTLKYVSAGELVPLLEEIISGERRERLGPFGREGGARQFVGPAQTLSQTLQGISPDAAARAARTRRDENRSTLSRSSTRQGRALRPQSGARRTASGSVTTTVIAPSLVSVLPGASDALFFDTEARALGVRGTVIADDRTNTLIITHTPPVLNRVETVLKALDVEIKLHVYQFKEADMVLLDLERRLAELLPGNDPQFQVEIGTATVMFRAPEDGADQIFEILRSWDKAPRQVYIEARILRVALDVVRDLGVSIQARDANKDGTEVGKLVDSLFPPDIPDSPQALLQFGDLTRDEYTVIIQALENEGFEDLLSTPKVTVIDRAQARFSVAVDEPFVEVVTDANSDITRESTRFIEVGVTLEVVPVIADGGGVTMDIRVGVSSLVGRSANGAPIVDRSEVSTRVLVEDGHTLAIGGLIVDSEKNTVNKIPWLGNIPLLGLLFQNSNKDTEKSEIIIFISPEIVGAGAKAPPPDQLKLEDLPQRDTQAPDTRRHSLSRSALPGLD